MDIEDITYRNFLNLALKLRPTSIEGGLDPHLEWPCGDLHEMEERMDKLREIVARNWQYADLRMTRKIQSGGPDKQDTYTIWFWREEKQARI